MDYTKVKVKIKDLTKVWESEEHVTVNVPDLTAVVVVAAGAVMVQITK